MDDTLRRLVPQGALSPRALEPSGRAPPAVLAVRTAAHFTLVPLRSILHVEAADNYVTIVADLRYRMRASLGRLCHRLAHLPLVRVHRSHAVNAAAVRELHTRAHGEFALVLADGTKLRSGRRYRDTVRSAFGA